MYLRKELDKLAAEYGYKSANLLLMQERNILIPPVLPLSHDICRAHLDSFAPQWKTLWEEFCSIQSKEATNLQSDSREKLRELRQLIIEAFKNCPLSNQEMNDYLKGLHADDLLMVRSSGMEDTEALANPGGNESFAGVKPDAQSISEAMGKVISSYFSEKSLEQRLKSRKETSADTILTEAFMPVLLQQMVVEKKESMVFSGVMYTSDRGIQIQAAPGHGELVVNSKGLVDSYFVTPEGVVHQQVHEKTIRMVCEEGKQGILIPVQNPDELRDKSSLLPNVIQRLAALGRQVEEFYGAPRDIEFVYDAKADKIYLVQARPIPASKTADVVPRAIAPEHIKTVKATAKQDKRLIITDAKTISPAQYAAQSVTDKKEVLVSNTIKEALEQVLAMEQGRVNELKVIVVQTDSPPTSHEAAEFNALGKAVMFVSKAQASQITQLINQSQSESMQLIFDTQRKLIVDWTEKKEAILKEGLFKSAMAAERTLENNATLLGALGYQNENQLREGLQAISSLARNQSLEAEAKKRDLGLYPCLIDLLEDIEAVNSNPKALENARNALVLLVKSFAAITKVNPGESPELVQRKKDLYFHGLAYALNINQRLNEIAKLTPDQPLGEALQKEMLNLVNGLEALLSNPGRKALFSDAIYQLAFERKAGKELKDNYSWQFTRLPADRKEKIIQLFRLGQTAANNNLRNEWTQFILGVASHGKAGDFERLTWLGHFAVQNNAAGILINNLFYQGNSVVQMVKQANESELLLQQTGFWKFSARVDEWETRISTWGMAKNYDKLIKEFDLDLESMLEQMKQFGDLTKLPLFAQARVLNDLARLTEVIDVSIKTMKGSRDYPDDEDKVQKFAQMLKNYHQLMAYVVNQVPDAIIKKRRMHTDDKTGKRTMLARIDSAFTRAQGALSPKHLSSSGLLAVNSALITSPANFTRQFNPDKGYHLEDLFSLFHQNIVTSISELSTTTQLPVQVLPSPLQALHEELSLMFSNIQFTSIMDKSNLIVMECNIPLRNHASKLYFNYDKEKSALQIELEIYGHNQNNRMDKIAQFSNEIFKQFGSNVQLIEEAKYDAASQSLKTSLVLKTEQFTLNHLFLLRIMKVMADMTYLHEQPTNADKKFFEVLQTFLGSSSPEEKLMVALKHDEFFIADKWVRDADEMDINRPGMKSVLKETFDTGSILVFLGLMERRGYQEDDMTFVDPDGNRLLEWIIREKNLNALNFLLSLPNIDINQKTKYENESLLIYAITESNPVITIALLGQKNIDVNVKDKNGFTPLMHATQRGLTTVIEELLKHNELDVNATQQVRITTFNNIRFFEQSTKIEKGKTALMLAVEHNHLEVVKQLLTNDSLNVNYKDETSYGEGLSALMIAVKMGNVQMVEMLANFKKTDLNLTSKNNLTALDYAHNLPTSPTKDKIFRIFNELARKPDVGNGPGT
ncbi:TPA: PEP/pyruvate-binding domain-containing protein [Legionella pneumophila]